MPVRRGPACYDRMASMNGTLPPRQRREREMLFWVSVIFMFAAAVLAARISIDAITIGVVGLIWCVVTNIVWITCTFCGMEYTKPRMMAWLMAQCLAIISCDVHYNTVMSSCWSVLVVIADLVLLLRLDSWFSLAYMGFAVSWLLVTFLERVLRFGLFDMPLTYDQDFRRELLNETVTCSALPCPLNPDSNGSEGMVAILIFVIDFMTTRYFAQQMNKEQDTMRSTVATMQDIALHLAAYDVDSVSQILEESEETLPHEMYAALKNLEQNLRGYRPYLPKSCLASMWERDRDMEESGTAGTRDLIPLDSLSVLSGSRRSDSYRVRSPMAGIGMGDLVEKRVSLLFVNLCGALKQVDSDLRAFNTAFTNMLHTTLQATEEAYGMVDLFVGDKVMCSFNASRRCLDDARAAAGAAKQIVRNLQPSSTAVSIGLASGRLACGDMGCSDMCRFGLVGWLGVKTAGLERAAAALGIAILTNTTNHRDAGTAHTMRVVPRALRFLPAAARQVVAYPTPARGLSLLQLRLNSADASPGGKAPQRDHEGSPYMETHVVYEVMASPDEGSSGPEEWMYELAHRQRWAGFNQAAEAFVGGASPEEAAARHAGGSKEEFLEVVMRVGSHEPLNVHV